jgi:uncharacterized protein YeaO (DUF488 family)
MVRLKRAYETPDRSDGYRVLVERLWPRGLRKATAQFDEWLKDVAPSDGLRKWFGHDPAHWAGFQTRYRRELHESGSAPLDALEQLVARAQSEDVTLVYSARDEEHNSALVLKDEIDRRLARRRPTVAAARGASRGRGERRRVGRR